MSPFYFVLIAVLALTILSGGAAGLLVALGAGKTQAQKSVIEKLIHIALLGAGAVMMAAGSGGLGDHRFSSWHFQFQGSSLWILLCGWAWMRAKTSASQA